MLMRGCTSKAMRNFMGHYYQTYIVNSFEQTWGLINLIVNYTHNLKIRP